MNRITHENHHLGKSDARKSREHASRLRGILCAVGVLVSGLSQAGAGVLYSTAFPSPPFSTGYSWAGVDGWLSNNDTISAAQGISDVNGVRYGYLGYSPPSNDVTWVWRSFNYNPLAKGDAVIEIQTRIEIEYSGNRFFDRFGLQIYNQNEDLLGSIVFDNTTRKIWRGNGPTDFNTGRTYDTHSAMNLQISVNFRTNRWSAKLDEAALFTETEFNGSGKSLDLGEVDYFWALTKSGSPGTNALRVYSLTVTAPPDPARIAALDARIKKLQQKLAKLKKQVRKAKSKQAARKLQKRVRVLQTQIRIAKTQY